MPSASLTLAKALTKCGRLISQANVTDDEAAKQYRIVTPTKHVSRESYGGDLWFRLAATVLQEDLAVINSDYLDDAALEFPRHKGFHETSPYISFYDKAKTSVDAMSLCHLVEHLKNVPKSNRPGIIVYNGAYGLNTCSGHYECYRRQRAPSPIVSELWREMLLMDVDSRKSGFESRHRVSPRGPARVT